KKKPNRARARLQHCARRLRARGNKVSPSSPPNPQPLSPTQAEGKGSFWAVIGLVGAVREPAIFILFNRRTESGIISLSNDRSLATVKEEACVHFLPRTRAYFVSHPVDQPHQR